MAQGDITAVNSSISFSFRSLHTPFFLFEMYCPLRAPWCFSLPGSAFCKSFGRPVVVRSLWDFSLPGSAFCKSFEDPCSCAVAQVLLRFLHFINIQKY